MPPPARQLTPPTDPILVEMRGLRADIQAHNSAAQKRHEAMMRSLNGQGKTIEEIAAGKNRWWAEVRRFAAWLGPTVWEMVRVPVGALLTGALLLALSKALGISPTTLLATIGPTPIPVQMQGTTP